MEKYSCIICQLLFTRTSLKPSMRQLSEENRGAEIRKKSGFDKWRDSTRPGVSIVAMKQKREVVSHMSHIILILLQAFPIMFALGVTFVGVMAAGFFYSDFSPDTRIQDRGRQNSEVYQEVRETKSGGRRE